MGNTHEMKRYAIVGTPAPAPTDGWSSYFDSWRAEDSQVPTFEPHIVDDELHPDLSSMRFNMDMEVDWDMDMQSPYVSSMLSNGKTRLNVAHPGHQRHGLPRNDVAGWERPGVPGLGGTNDEAGWPLRQIQIGAAVDPPGVEELDGAQRTVKGPLVMPVGVGSDVLPRVAQVGVRRAFQVKVCCLSEDEYPPPPHYYLHHHSPFMPSLLPLPLVVSLVNHHPLPS